MPTTTTFFFLLLFLSSTSYSSSSATHNRRKLLHQPFFPIPSSSSSSSSNSNSPPPSQPPSPSPSPPLSKYPFSGSTPDQHSPFSTSTPYPDPFFPSDSTPPPPSPPPPPPSTSSFPANISSLIFPHSPSSSSSSSKPLSIKLIAVTVTLSLSAALLAALALFFFFFFFQNRNHKPDTPPPPPPPPAPPVLSKPSNNSSEFLYLGTLVNSAAANAIAGGARRGNNARKLQSPELHPLPPLNRRPPQQQQLHQLQEEDQEEFGNNNAGRQRGNSGDSTSSESSSTTTSPARSASVSISPPASESPKNRLNPKSELLQVQHTPAAASPPLPEMMTSSYSLSSIVKEEEEEEEDEAEESPLLSNASSSAGMITPAISGRLSPAEEEDRDWGVLGRASPPLSNASTPNRNPKSSPIASLKIPAFFLSGKRRDSSNSSLSSSSPVSPHSLPSPISSSASSSAGNTPRMSSASAGTTPRMSFSGRFSPRLSNLSDVKSSSEKVAPTPPPPPPPRPPVTEATAVEKRVPDSSRSIESLPRLKPLHWDKVRASSDREMFWDQLRASSFKVNEEMIETLFIVNAPNPNQKDMPRKAQHSQVQENRVLDPKKAQNIAILLRALNVTMEEVCEALLDGNVDTLGTELLECLLRMAPTKEEERKLKEYKDESPFKLGQAEKFVKAVIDIPFAFKRVEAMLYFANFESQVEYLKKSFETLEAACDELRNSRMFLKLLEAVLKTGNRMNVGTNRGDAHAFKLDTLLKLVDVKGADGKTTLLHFVVQEIIRSEGQRFLTSTPNHQTSTDEAKCRKLGLQVVSNISSELTSVKKAAAMDSDALSNDMAKLTLGIATIGEMVRLNEQTHLQEPKRRFSESMNKFIKTAEEEIIRVQAEESVALSLVKEITEYFHGNSAKEEAHPFRIFMVVRDFLAIVDRVCKEVGTMINSEQTTISSTHRFPVPVHPMLPISMNPLLPRVFPGFAGTRQSSFSEDDGSP